MVWLVKCRGTDFEVVLFRQESRDLGVLSLVAEFIPDRNSKHFALLFRAGSDLF